MAAVDARRVVDDAERVLAPLEQTFYETEWDLAHDATDANAELSEQANIALQAALADPGLADDAAAAQAEGGGDDIVARQAEILRLTTAGARRTEDEIQRIAGLETALNIVYARHRGSVGGREISNNEIEAILATSADPDERRAAWEASKGVGAQVDADLRELVRLRNDVARRLGYRDHYAMAIELQEIDEGWLFASLDELEAGVAEAWTAERGAIDAQLRARAGIEGEGPLEPWFQFDMFAQEPVPADDDPLGGAMAGVDIVGSASAYFSALGFDVSSILARSDLEPREGKHQHAFMVNVDRRTDIRISCNNVQTPRWLDTTLHELGHAVYEASIDPSLPWLLSTGAHIAVHESSSMLHGRRYRDPHFLTRFAGLDDEVANAPGNLTSSRRHLLTMTMWVQVMAHFERALYADPDGDLGTLWWDLVERYQRVRRPEGERPHDWATKMHLAQAPVYYHNYLLGEVIASHLEEWLERETGDRSPAGEPVRVGRVLRERYYRPGSLYRWDDLIERATGEALTVAPFVRQASSGSA